jgi:YidC/Oxa1 family membrane protein insertase
MDRVQIGAIALAVLLVLAWLYTMPTSPTPAPAPTPVPPEPGEIAAPALPTQAIPTEVDAPAPSDDTTRQYAGSPPPEEEVIVTRLANDDLEVRVSNAGGRVVGASLSGYRDRVGSGAGPVQLVTSGERGVLQVRFGDGELEGFAGAPYSVISHDRRSLVLRRELDGLLVERVLTLEPEGYGARLSVKLENHSARSLRPEFQLLLYGVERPSGAPDRFQRYSLAGLSDGDVQRTPVGGIGSPGLWRNLTGKGPWRGEGLEAPIDWMAVDSQYFLIAAIPENPGEAHGFFGPAGRDAGVAVLSYPAFDVPSGTRIERSYRLYLGPKISTDLIAIDPQLDAAIEAGWTAFRPLVDLFAWMLRWTYLHVVSNYGVAIILLTILIRLVTYPLTQKSMKSMKKFQVISPQLKEVQEKYKGDKERLHQEVMALYKRTGINPMTALGGGCLPMLLQFPFLIALYFALQASIDLRHAPFVLWITDLSAPEDLFSIAGCPIRPLPLVMGATMVLQQRLMPSAGADAQQRQMMTIMSVAFIFLFYQFPSGLVLYWFVSNLLGILQQVWVNRTPTEKAGG